MTGIVLLLLRAALVLFRFWRLREDPPELLDNQS